MICPKLHELPPPPPGKTGWPWTEASNDLHDSFSGIDSWPVISIVTPSFNQGEYIEETIRSLLLQGYPNLEYLVIDGGSTDNSVEIIRKYEPWLAYWVSEPDRGQTHAVNKGFQLSSGEILAWLNSDDTYEKNALQRVARLMVEKPDVDLLYGNVKIIDESGQTITELRSVPFDSTAFYYETVHIASQSAVFWRRDLFFKVGMLDENYSFAMDRELLVRFIQEGAKFWFLHSLLGTYRCHSSSKTFGTADKSKQELLQIKEIADVRNRSDYKLRRLFYRLRQFTYLTMQGDLPYMLSRLRAKFRPSAFDRL
ncbi:glycosyltransferase [filamentous cyanobacterium CCP3]|nr:glycosyltransferase [filamentous cyanobacterium CCP3]